MVSAPEIHDLDLSLRGPLPAVLLLQMTSGISSDINAILRILHMPPGEARYWKQSLGKQEAGQGMKVKAGLMGKL